MLGYNCHWYLNLTTISGSTNGVDIDQEDEIPQFYSNLDLDNITTPVDAEAFAQAMSQAGYEGKKIDYLYQGFKYDFDIEYAGPQIRRSVSDNIPLKIGSKTQFWNKLIKEVKLKRVTGPYDEIPFDNFIQSLIGLVPKKGSDKLRLIFHLSYDFGTKDEEKSLNHHTPMEKCSMKYNDLDCTTRACFRVKRRQQSHFKSDKSSYKSHRPIFLGKTDVQSAFRIVPLLQKCWHWLLMKAENPKTGIIQYFVDKCLPFGASISWAIFQAVSDALKHIIEFKAKAFNTVTNYLDDFLFLAYTLELCNQLIY